MSMVFSFSTYERKDVKAYELSLQKEGEDESLGDEGSTESVKSFSFSSYLIRM